MSNVAISPSGAYAYATNQSLNSLAVISLASNTLVGNIPVQQNPTSVAVTPNGARAFVTNGNSSSVSVVDTASNTVIATLGVGANPTSVAITPDGSRAEVTNAQGYSTSLLDANYLYVIGTLDRVGIFPSGVTIAPAVTSILCNYSLSTSGQAMPYSGGSGYVGLYVAVGCNWTAASNANWITLVSGLSGTGIGTTGFNVSANPYSTPRSGAIVIAGQTFTITQAAAPAVGQPPTADSITPGGGSGSSQTFRAVFSDPAGFANLNYAHILINGSLSANSSCWVVYLMGSNGLFLINDLGTAWLPPVTPGVPGTVSNSQCTLDAGASSVYGSGNSLVVNVALTFKSSFSGSKYLYAFVKNMSNLDSGWRTMATWAVQTAQGNPPPTADSTSPGAGTGMSGVFTATYSDPNGSGAVSLAELLFNNSLSGANACWVVYSPQWKVYYLADDTGGTALGPMAAGVPGILQNSQCILNVAASSATTSGSNSVVVNFGLAFKAGFAGAKNQYILAVDAANLNSGWQNRGSWYVQ